MTSGALATLNQIRATLGQANTALRNEENRRAAIHAQLAQVHATLAVAEQQRLRNLIAYADLTLRKGDSVPAFLEAQIRHGLDLDDMASDYEAVAK